MKKNGWRIVGVENIIFLKLINRVFITTLYSLKFTTVIH